MLENARPVATQSGLARALSRCERCSNHSEADAFHHDGMARDARLPVVTVAPGASGLKPRSLGGGR